MLQPNEQFQYGRLTASGLVKAGNGLLGGFMAASGTPTIKLWDGLSAAGPIILNTSAALVPMTWYRIPIVFTNGLFASITGAGDITFAYN